MATCHAFAASGACSSPSRSATAAARSSTGRSRSSILSSRSTVAAVAVPFPCSLPADPWNARAVTTGACKRRGTRGSTLSASIGLFRASRCLLPDSLCPSPPPSESWASEAASSRCRRRRHSRPCHAQCSQPQPQSAALQNDPTPSSASLSSASPSSATSCSHSPRPISSSSSSSSPSPPHTWRTCTDMCMAVAAAVAVMGSSAQPLLAFPLDPSASPQAAVVATATASPLNATRGVETQGGQGLLQAPSLTGTPDDSEAEAALSRRGPIAAVADASGEVCEEGYGFLPCSTTVGGNIFLMAVFGYILFKAAQLISEGSELLLEVLNPGLIGGLLLPLLGAFPDAVLIFASGLGGTKEQAQEEVLVGVGVLAGSSVLILSLTWAASIVAGRCDLTGPKGTAKERTLTRGWDWQGTGVSTDSQTKTGAAIMLLALLPLLVIQIPLLDGHPAEGPEASLIGAILSLAGCAAFCTYQVLSPWLQSKKIEAARMQYVRTQALKALSSFTLPAAAAASAAGTDGKQQASFLLQLAEEEEAANSAASMSTSTSTGRLHRLFQLFDADNSGTMSMAELRALLVALGVDSEGYVPSEQQVEAWMADFDVDGDGHISEDEFVAGIRRWTQHVTEQGMASSSSSSALQPTGVAALAAVSGGRGGGGTAFSAGLALLGSGVLPVLASQGGAAGAAAVGAAAGVGAAVDAGAGAGAGAGEGVSGNVGTAVADAGSSLLWIAEYNKAKEVLEMLYEEDGGLGGGEDEEGEGDHERKEGEALSPSQIYVRAGGLLLAGAATAAFFADPMVGAISSFSRASHIPAFFVAFVVTPFASNASELVSSLIFASKKTKRSMSLTISSLYGAVIMNYTLCLGLFLVIVVLRGLVWDFSSEVTVLAVVTAIVGVIGATRTTFPLSYSVLGLALYPAAITGIAYLDYALGWQ